ncbi:hypothetical protein COT50_00570 [candidate division WWE3 bacterium CG08_land_8_20_14_0_20_41_10]|uniref:Triosephosphate isomerase n=1 Tax=candidate division WWE3 bacterium CG08_land_8_20_14_0_20_41_10 TaxID=1975085 RepID=A0A2H0XCL6_UNCKA|nr:MAG: hypothetical protein COT50_00570 [candidate division WWE3 bacterium CG08_land_8_20_14_0_20_41_10]
MRYIVANWKQNKTLDKALLWCKDFVRLVGDMDLKNVTPIICPPAPFLEKLAGESALGMELAVQDISPYADGAHTGFVGINQVKQFCRYALVGHSERRESRDVVMEKISQCLHADIVPIVCFKSSTDYQIIKGAIYALEDPDNISVDGVYRPKNSHEVQNLVYEAKNFFGGESTIIYGGSVNTENAESLASISNLDGVLVGNASLNPLEFVDIVKKFL